MRRRQPGLLGTTVDTATVAVRTSFNTVNTALAVVAKSAEIVDIKLDEINLEAWADLQETKQETFTRLKTMGMSEEEMQTSYEAHGFK